MLALLRKKEEPTPEPDTKVKILLFESDQDIIDCVCRCLEPERLDVIVARTLREAIALIPVTDILFVDYELNGATRVVLDSWLEQNGGPACVISDSVDSDMTIDLLSGGVSNVISKNNLTVGAVKTIAGRYKKNVFNRRAMSVMEKRIGQLEETVSKQTRWIIGLIASICVLVLIETPTAYMEIIALIATLF